MRREKDRSILATACSFIVAIVACSSAPSGLIRHKALSDTPTAQVDVVLAKSGPCVYGTAPTRVAKLLVLWPPEYSLRGTDIVNGFGSVVATLGGMVRLGGGEYPASQVEFLRTLLIDDLPAECANGPFWLVSVAS
jgi:hypothetical protein